MKMKSIAIACAALTLLSTAFSVNAETPKFHGQRCELGATCSIPGNDSGITYFSITPKNGLVYQCRVNSGDGKVRFYVTSGKDFHIETGDGIYLAQPEVLINIVGHFENPLDENDEGQIKFIKLTGEEGSVSCNIAS